MADSIFEIEAVTSQGGARAGRLRLPHGEALTPLFMPVGTLATVKALAPDDLRSLGASVVLANTYHLYLRPGAELVQQLGGLHHFMAWSGGILTDSGGFQVFSLGHMNRIDDDGVTFRSHIDGSTHYLDPECAIAIQEQLGADIIMAFDECTPYPCERNYAEAAMQRTHRWAERSLRAQRRPDQSLFGIVQGSVYPALRRESARFIASLPFPGLAIGGLSVGEPKQLMYDVLAETTAALPTDRPRYLMGVGSPEDLLEGIDRGVDMFDCVLPTRVARNGSLFTPQGRVNLLNAAHRQADQPLEPGCDCYTCRSFSRAYLHHLFRNRELLAYRLASIHNLRFLQRLMTAARAAVMEDRFDAFKRQFLDGYRLVDEAVREEQRQKWQKRGEAGSDSKP